MKILFDHAAPAPLRHHLAGHLADRLVENVDAIDSDMEETIGKFDTPLY